MAKDKSTSKVSSSAARQLGKPKQDPRSAANYTVCFGVNLARMGGIAQFRALANKVSFGGHIITIAQPKGDPTASTIAITLCVKGKASNRARTANSFARSLLSLLKEQVVAA